MLIPVTLTAAAGAALINIWLSLRIGQLRTVHKINIGDGGNEALSRRMRAQLNFAENVPLVLVMVAALEISDKGGSWLLPVVAVFLLGRIAHGLGMDSGALKVGRFIGTLVTLLTQLGLAIMAILAVAGQI